MSAAPAFVSVGEAMDMARAALGYLAAADAAQLAAAELAEYLQTLEQTDAISTAVRASFLAAFTARQGYCEDADYSPRAWLIHKTGITKGAAVGHTAWAKRASTHPRVLAALAAGQASESVGRMICLWTDRLPEKFRQESDELLLTAAMAGLGLQELGALAAEMYERSRADLPDEDPARAFEDPGGPAADHLPGRRGDDRGPDSGMRRDGRRGAGYPVGSSRSGRHQDPGSAVSRRAAGGYAPAGR